VTNHPESEHDEQPLAYVVLKEGHKATEKEIQDFMSKQVTRSKWLTGGVRFVDMIPKNPVSGCTSTYMLVALQLTTRRKQSGKILRKVLRDRAKAEMEDSRVRAKL
jgi:acyl-coenzyme A synthetase/AMP-(fatty) acid ligase